MLGGVFQRGFPLQKKMEPPKSIWNWSKDEEKATLGEIYQYFRESWKLIEGKSSDNPDLILVGTGISRMDVPALFIRSVLHKVESESALYETYFKTKIVDLGDVGIALFKPDPRFFGIYPKTTNALMSRLGIPSHKQTGKSVWELYEAHEYEAIKERTKSEVDAAVRMASLIAEGRF